MNLRELLNPRQILRSLTIRLKVMIGLILVSLFSIIGVSTVSLHISRQIILDNTDKMAHNIVKQIAFNLDERIMSFENTTFSIMQQYDMNRLFTTDAEEDAVSKRQKELVLSDAINQSSALFSYVKYAFVENELGNLYHYNYSYPSDGSISHTGLTQIRDTLLPNLDKRTPRCWMKIGDELFFARLLIDYKDFSIKGIAVFSITDSFFDFLDDRDILSKRNLIISRKNNILFQGGYDSKDTGIAQFLNAKGTKQISSGSIQYQDQKTLVTAVTTQRKNWRILCLIRAVDMYQKDWLIIMLTAIIAVGVFLLSILITFFIAKSITRNIFRMEICMSNVERGDFQSRMKPASYDEVGKLGLRLNYMITQMESLIDAVASERISKQHAEFQALQAQVNPHFLYNTLGSIKWIANRQKDTEVESMVDALITLLKGSIKKSISFQTVGDEICYIKNYVTLQKMRYGDAFEMRYEIDPQLSDAIIPGFLLQPIVENAIYHGIDVAGTGGIITVRGFLQKGKSDVTILQVEDNGIGVTDEKIQEIMQKPKEYKGFNSIGVNLVYERLRVYYGNACSFSINSEVGRGTVVEMALPFATEPPEQEGMAVDANSHS